MNFKGHTVQPTTPSYQLGIVENWGRDRITKWPLGVCLSPLPILLLYPTVPGQGLTFLTILKRSTQTNKQTNKNQPKTKTSVRKEGDWRLCFV